MASPLYAMSVCQSFVVVVLTLTLPCNVKWGFSSWKAAVTGRGGGRGGLLLTRGSRELFSGLSPGMNVYKSSYWFSLPLSTSGGRCLASAPDSRSFSPSAVSFTSAPSALCLYGRQLSWWRAGFCMAAYDEECMISCKHTVWRHFIFSNFVQKWW